MKFLKNIKFWILLFLAFSQFCWFLYIFEMSHFNVLSKLKEIDFRQIKGGFYISSLITIMFLTLKSIIKEIIKNDYPDYIKNVKKYFKIIDKISFSFFITFWALLSLKEVEFNILATSISIFALLTNFDITLLVHQDSSSDKEK
ncbi:hypothetical protein BN1356_02546 [Streptococcus varani]|uniref:Uncharacterized protein n=1 Tax=Streptococcus varani TaxID=1608583 RepID=A0A0E4H9M3_9STRE|nr:hypothetical protein [Streptococcus varani]CQR26188.1 hypothetical protein BN1356_02546 [Streptococcus varani]